MANYLKISTIAGPLSPAASMTLPSGVDPALVNGSFDAPAFQIGFSATGAIFSKGGSAAAGTKVEAGPAVAYLYSTGQSARILLSAAKGVAIPTIHVFSTARPAGGVSGSWVYAWWRYDECFITRFQSSNGGDERDGQELSWEYKKLTYVSYADPAGGVLGAATTMTWDIAAGTAS